MAKVIVYTTSYCPYCIRAKALLSAKGVPFEEIDLTNEDEMRMDLVKRTGRRTVPQIFIDDTSIGGYEELQALEDQGELEPMLAS